MSEACHRLGRDRMPEVEVDVARRHPEWDAWLAAAPGGSHLQSSGWGYVKAGAGWRPVRILLRDSGRIVGGFQLLTRHIPGLGAIAYLPRGPVLASRDVDLFDAAMTALRGYARQQRIAVVKVQPPVDRTDLPALLAARGLRPSSLPTTTAVGVVVDTSPERDEAELFRALRATVRNTVRQAPRRGLSVRVGGARDLPLLERIVGATARRQGFAPYPPDYYRRLWTAFGTAGQARLVVVEHGGAAVSAMLLVAFGDSVHFKVGGWAGAADSPPGANELMHWTGIAWAHEAGYRRYDLEDIDVELGQAIHDGRPVEPDGVAFFKLGFGGHVVVYPGTYDLLPGSVTGPVLRRVLPRAERWQGVVHRLAGRKGDHLSALRRAVRR